MLHNDFEDLVDEVGNQEFREYSPYDRNPSDYIKLGELDFETGEGNLDQDLLNHVLAMDARAAARPIVQEVTE